MTTQQITVLEKTGVSEQAVSTEVLDRRAFIIISTAVGCGFAVIHPGFLDKFPSIIRDSLSSGIGTGGLIAIILNIVIPKEKNVKIVQSPINR